MNYFKTPWVRTGQFYPHRQRCNHADAGWLLPKSFAAASHVQYTCTVHALHQSATRERPATINAKNKFGLTSRIIRFPSTLSLAIVDAAANSHPLSTEYPPPAFLQLLNSFIHSGYTSKYAALINTGSRFRLDFTQSYPQTDEEV